MIVKEFQYFLNYRCSNLLYGFHFAASVKNLVEPTHESDRCNRGSYNVTDRFSKKYCKYLVLNEEWQDKDQRNQQDQLS